MKDHHVINVGSGHRIRNAHIIHLANVSTKRAGKSRKLNVLFFSHNVRTMAEKESKGDAGDTKSRPLLETKTTGCFVVGTVTCLKEHPTIQCVFSTLSEAKKFCETLGGTMDDEWEVPHETSSYKNGEAIHRYYLTHADYRAAIAADAIYEYVDMCGLRHEVSIFIIFSNDCNLNAVWKTLRENNG